MELHQLRYFVAVARSGNFSRAAGQCHVAQPSLSQQIQKLEDELGERLFDRLKHCARLTPAGQNLLPRARRILDEVDAAQREARESHALARGTVGVGVLPTIAPYFLPDVVVAFGRRFPGIEVIVREDTTARLLELALACEIDIAVASQPIADDRFEVRDLFVEELLLTLPSGHPLARKRSITMADLDAERFILMKEEHCLGEQVLSFCSRHDFRPQVSCRSAQIETIHALVRAGLGISLIPRMAVPNPPPPGLAYCSIRAPRPQRKIVIVWLRQRPPGRAAGEFVKEAQDHAGSDRRR